MKEFAKEILKDHKGEVVTRFPPEPNGYLHIGHAKSIVLNFSLSEDNGYTNLRFDDTNPDTESKEFVESIIRDVEWLGFTPRNILYASDYFEDLYSYAVTLIEKGLAYVDDSTPEEIAISKGTPVSPGTPTAFRDREKNVNLELFRMMREGKFADGSKVLRAKIDMTHPNMHMRDPILYRIKRSVHHRTGEKWCIYPMYDFAHGQSDSIEKITHSVCTLEFASHRELYDWFIEKLEIFPSKQYEFSRLNITGMNLSKRFLKGLVETGQVTGWDDPRMPTISGMRRKGYPAEAIVEFCDRIGVSSRENVIEKDLLEFCVREKLNEKAKRKMVVLDPVKLIIEDPEDAIFSREESLKGIKILRGDDEREIIFTKEIFVESEDFREVADNKWFRLSPGKFVRLKNACIVKCESFEKDEEGKVTLIRCSFVPSSFSGNDNSGIKAKGTIHWVSSEINEEILVNPCNEIGMPNRVYRAFAETSIIETEKYEPVQFLRKGYFCKDDHGVFNHTVSLKESYK
jgi:glutaminyl-tRNA synthetase